MATSQKPHPGRILLRQHMRPLGISGNRLAMILRVPANRVTDIIRGRRGITADTALRLARAFRTTPEYWMDLQTGFELCRAEPGELDKITAIIGAAGA